MWEDFKNIRSMKAECNHFLNNIFLKSYKSVIVKIFTIYGLKDRPELNLNLFS